MAIKLRRNRCVLPCYLKNETRFERNQTVCGNYFGNFNVKIHENINHEMFQLKPNIFARINVTTGEIIELEGFEGMILDTLSRKINFTFELIDCNVTWG